MDGGFIVGRVYNHVGRGPYYGKGFRCLYVTEDGWALLRGAGGWPPKLVLATSKWEPGTEDDFGSDRFDPAMVGTQMDYMRD